MSFAIRPMAGHDLDAVLALAASSNQAPHWSRAAYQEILDPSGPLQRIPSSTPMRPVAGAALRRIPSPTPMPPVAGAALRRVAFVAQGHHALSGFAVASWLPQESAAELESLVVDPIDRRQGIGSALLQACMRSAALAGASSIRLEVRMSNAAALALYQRQGFASTGIRRGYYSHPVEDAVLLQAPLGSSGPL